MLNKFNPWTYSVVSAILLALSWPPSPFPFLVFIDWVPLLFLEDNHYRVADKPLAYYLQVSLMFTLWNAITTYWTWFASPAGAVAAILLNAQFQTFPWLFFHRSRKVFGDKLAFPALIAFSLSIEYLHLNWDIAWPWLNLGNVFASSPWMVQWYEFTGVLGGSIWIYLVNILVVKSWPERSRKAVWLKPALLVLLPVAFSLILLAGIQEPKHPGFETVVVQPNIDPYTDKFEGMRPEEQLQRLLDLTDAKVTDSTRLVLWPETALTDYLDEAFLSREPSIQRIQEWVNRHPQCALLTGASTVKYYQDGEKKSETARQHPADASLYYDAYNTALYFEKDQVPKVYHKSKLVPGVEKMPYPAVFGFLENLSIDLGGTSGSLGSSDSAVVFFQDEVALAPIICYESVFGGYVSEYIRNGAGVLAIITNDGWWKDTPGYRQHFHYARLRAIENRMYVARSANTGISGFIDPKGNIIKASSWWQQDALKAQIKMQLSRTFYAESGDYLGRMAAFFAVLILIGSYVRRKTAKGY
ncbi:MAG: apolipoprotein N-acyltransferase [Bacteroidota bacterium]|nr:apolipoprotein N-acyltransferase [Bacteroidota bacterium]MDX5430728.1 apolipoprotein N-acyltransferase [Bacteroidota bacterium]MDX5469475.1 apolipoprotein N-acyltransferase [Bacteroidota bacterium]